MGRCSPQYRTEARRSQDRASRTRRSKRSKHPPWTTRASSWQIVTLERCRIVFMRSWWVRSGSQCRDRRTKTRISPTRRIGDDAPSISISLLWRVRLTSLPERLCHREKRREPVRYLLLRLDLASTQRRSARPRLFMRFARLHLIARISCNRTSQTSICEANTIRVAPLDVNRWNRVFAA
jgi:hypothetical protein